MVEVLMIITVSIFILKTFGNNTLIIKNMYDTQPLIIQYWLSITYDTRETK